MFLYWPLYVFSPFLQKSFNFSLILSFKIEYFADDPFGDPKAIGDPYCTLFVARLSPLTTEDTISKVSFSFSFFNVFSLLDAYRMCSSCMLVLDRTPFCISKYEERNQWYDMWCDTKEMLREIERKLDCKRESFQLDRYKYVPNEFQLSYFRFIWHEEE